MCSDCKPQGARERAAYGCRRDPRHARSSILSITMPADGISAATRERGLRYVAVFWQLASSHGEPNVSYKGSELKGFARSIWSGIELARITARGTFETCQPY